MTDFELAIKYKPYIMMDKNEPFEITAIGYTIFRETRDSLSFSKRKVVVDKKTVAYVIEYAVWYDYDIQHLYELEHLWVFVGLDGQVVDAEGSFHGKYLKMISPDTDRVILEEETHIVVYAQPGKHAFFSSPNLIRLVPNWYDACNLLAGVNGILVHEMFKDKIHTNDELQAQVEEYIKIKFSFDPSFKFQKCVCEDVVFMTWETLYKSIPTRVNQQIQKIKDFYEE